VLPGPLVKAEQEGDLITICTDTSKACRQPQQHLLPLPTFAWFAQSQSDIASAAGPAVLNSVELTRSGAPLRYYRQPLHFSADPGLSADHSLQLETGLLMRVSSQAWTWHQRRLQKL